MGGIYARFNTGNRYTTEITAVCSDRDYVETRQNDLHTYTGSSKENIRPYLHSMTSMTEEEKWDFGRIFNSFSYLKLELLENGLSFHEIYDITGICDITWNELNTAIDWLNAHHFDYRGLIEMGLAIETPE